MALGVQPAALPRRQLSGEPTLYQNAPDGEEKAPDAQVKALGWKVDPSVNQEACNTRSNGSRNDHDSRYERSDRPEVPGPVGNRQQDSPERARGALCDADDAKRDPPDEDLFSWRDKGNPDSHRYQKQRQQPLRSEPIGCPSRSESRDYSGCGEGSVSGSHLHKCPVFYLSDMNLLEKHDCADEPGRHQHRKKGWQKPVTRGIK